MPLPSVSPSPTPSPSPSPTSRLPVLPTNSFVDDLFNLPGLRDLPFQSTLKSVTELALLLILFLLLRRIISRLASSAIDRIAHHADADPHGRASRIRTLGQLSTSMTLYTLSFIFGVSALTVVGFPIASLIASAGVAGVAIGFGAQKVVKDVFTGFFMLLENQYAVGDYVTINSVTGTVEEFAMRTTRIRDDDGKLYILSNGDIAQVCNQSRGAIAGTFDIAVAAAADIAKATEVLNQALEEKSKELGLAQPATVRGIASVDATKTTFAVRFGAEGSLRPGAAAYQLREAAYAALAKAQIPIG